MKNKYRFLAVSLCLVPVMVLAGSKNFSKGSSYTTDDLPVSKFKSELLRLSPESQNEALRRLRKFDFNDKDVPHMGVSSEGGIFFADPAPPKLTAAQIAKAQSITPQLISAVDAFKLHSKPGATNTIYLDFDGHTITGTAWNTGPGQSYVAKPFNSDGLPGFSQTELDAIAEIWHRVAEDYAPFNVDVTTEAPLTFGPTVGRLLITDNVDANGVAMPSSTAGGVAYVNVWGAANYASLYSPALVYANNLGPNYAPFISEAASHEMGHNLSLNHDATATLGYYGGHGTGLISWGPIMGTGYNRNVSQWSKGEYPGANNLEDDITLITNRLGAKADDHGNASTSATPLVVSSTGVIAVTTPETDPLNTNPNNKGIISTAADVDYFRVNAGIGPATFTVTPSWAAYRKDGNRGTNLDVQATLYNAAGAVIAQVNPLTDTSATISTTIATAGTYYLAVTGVGNTTPITVGGTAPYYSDYGSLGMYYIAGSVVPTVINDVTPPTPNPMTWLSAPNANGSTNSIAMTGSLATDNSGGPVQYLFTCVSGGIICPSSAWQTSNQYTATGLTPATTYTYTVQARDASGNVTTASATASATTAAPDVTPPTPNPMTWLSVPNANGSSNSIAMTASVATDASGPVQYQFTCTAPAGLTCPTSAWQTSNQYTATGLNASTSYSFVVRARDASLNVTNPSVSASATTAAVALAAPVVTGSVTATGKVFRWVTVPTATSYTYWRCNEVRNAITGVITCTYPTTPNLTINVSSATTAVSVSTTIATPIRVKVQARRTVGTTTITSAFSNEVRL